jgi:hypothetical protein
MTTVNYPVAPTVTKRRGTLLDAATVTNQFAWLDGEALFDSYNCLSFGAQPVFCGPNAKTLDQASAWVDGVRFGAYGGITCKAVAMDVEQAKQRVQQAFEAGESTAVEAGLMEYRFVANDPETADLPGGWAAPTDITPAAGAVKAAAGVALLEGYASRNYAGAPTLHLPVSIASLLAGVDTAVMDGNILRTKLGSKIAAGAGYDFPNTSPDGAEAAVGEKWLYATGEVVVGRSELQLREGFDQSTNDVVILAERGYVVAVDCFVAAIRVKVE